MENGEAKRKRGRPKAFDAVLEATAQNLALLQGGTRRGNLNTMWRLQAMGCLWDNYEPAFRWLLDDMESCGAGTGRSRRHTILSELGRFGDDEEAILDFARLVCERKLPTKYAVAMIRAHRIGRPAQPSVSILADTILTTVCNYKDTHPDTTPDQIVAALLNVADRYMNDIVGLGEAAGDDDE
jgi:hypothetical protein